MIQSRHSLPVRITLSVVRCFHCKDLAERLISYPHIQNSFQLPKVSTGSHIHSVTIWKRIDQLSFLEQTLAFDSSKCMCCHPQALYQHFIHIITHVVVSFFFVSLKSAIWSFSRISRTRTISQVHSRGIAIIQKTTQGLRSLADSHIFSCMLKWVVDLLVLRNLRLAAYI